MKFAHKYGSLAIMTLFCVLTGSAEALQLGQSRADILARHGAPGAEDRAKNTAVYFWEGWSAQAEFQKDAVAKLTYRRNWYLGPTETNSLLQSNGGVTHWRELPSGDGRSRLWSRDDGAKATCLAEHALSMTFLSPEAAANAGATPTVSIPVLAPQVTTSLPAERAPVQAAPPAPAPAAATPAPNYPKHVENTPVADSASPETPTTDRSVVKLPAQEVASTDAAPPEKAPEKAELKPVTRKPKVIPGGEAKDASPIAAEAVETSFIDQYGGLLFSLILLGAIGAGAALYYGKIELPSWSFLPSFDFLRRRSKGGDDLSSAEATTEAASGPPALNTLPRDRFELLVSEIFRRLGYAVELSAALSADDAIDLTLRRDSETILVQCKYWNSIRVTSKELQKFHEAMSECGAPRGIFVTMGSFSRDARDFAATRDIDLMDKAAMEECVTEVSKPGENFFDITGWIEEFASQARIFDPECPMCRETMVLRTSRAGGPSTWTCRSFPKCPGQREPRYDLQMVAANH